MLFSLVHKCSCLFLVTLIRIKNKTFNPTASFLSTQLVLQKDASKPLHFSKKITEEQDDPKELSLEYDSKCSSKDEAEKKTRLLSFLTIGSLSIKAKLLPATNRDGRLKDR
jgi:hypothetical protein